MNTGLIPPAQYRDSSHLSSELSGVFRRCWYFAGLRFEMEGRKHRAINVAGVSVLVQMDRAGRPRAFLNSCVHRHAALSSPGLHEGPVRCPYHGWVYDREGQPAGVTARDAFGEVLSDPASHRLEEFACESVGEFIFVRLHPTGSTLREYLGSQHDFLLRASEGMASIEDEFRDDVHANWKVVIENSLEGYHVPAVHSNTFADVDGMKLSDQKEKFFFTDLLHSSLEHPASVNWMKRFQRIERMIGQWPWRFEHYTHHLIFPNLTVTSFLGYSFHVQVFEPTATDRTTVHSRTVGIALHGGSPEGRRVIERIYADNHQFTRRVFEEDGGICRKVQQGLANATRFALLAAGAEDRVLHFHRAYRHALERFAAANA